MEELKQSDFSMRIIREIPRVKGVRHRAVFECKKCKKEIEAFVQNMNKKDRINSGLCKSCATIHFHTTHGMHNTKLYSSWRSMRKRCYYEKGKDYKNYGGKGIRVCKEWSDSFEEFKIWAIENGYMDGLTIDRKNVKKDYVPDNCRWIPRQQQSENKNTIQRNNKTGYRGVSKPTKYLKFLAIIEVNKQKINLGVFENASIAGRAYDCYVIEHKLNRPLNFSDKYCNSSACIHRRGCILSIENYNNFKKDSFFKINDKECMPDYSDIDNSNGFEFLDRFRLSDGSPLKK